MQTVENLNSFASTAVMFFPVASLEISLLLHTKITKKLLSSYAFSGL